MSEVPKEIHEIPKSVWRLTVKRARVLAGLAELDHCNAEQIAVAARRLRLKRAMVYRLLGQYKQSLQATSIIPTKPGRRPGSKQLEPVQEKIIERLIKGFYLTRQRPSIAALHRSIGLECYQAQVKSPSYKAVWRRVEDLTARDAVKARDGAKAASDRFRPVKGRLLASEPLEVIQIDHTLVDVMIVDELQRKPIGRPWLTLAIDVATRTIPGFFLSLNMPSATSTAMVISRAVLSKDGFLAELNLDAEWPMRGIPRRLHLDNGKEFHSRALARGCEEYGIEIVHRPPRRPHYGGHIERLIGTLMGEVHLLPGTTFSSVAKRGTYDPAAKAIMTLQEVEVWLAWQIAAVYHLTRHSALRAAPLDTWNKGLLSMRKSLREPNDPKQFYLAFLPFRTRAVGRDGLRLFNITYWHGALTAYINDGKKHLVKYDPRDLSRVYLLESGGSYLEVPYKDLAHGKASLAEIQRGARTVRDAGGRVADQAKLFQAIEKQRQVVSAAKDSTLKARRLGQQQSKNDTPGFFPAIRPSPPSDMDKDEPADPFPFEIWHE